MFKVEPNLKEIATRQLTQRRARKEGESQRPVTTVKCKALYGLQFRAMVEGTISFPMKATRPVAMMPAPRRCAIFSAES